MNCSICGRDFEITREWVPDRAQLEESVYVGECCTIAKLRKVYKETCKALKEKGAEPQPFDDAHYNVNYLHVPYFEPVSEWEEGVKSASEAQDEWAQELMEEVKAAISDARADRKNVREQIRKAKAKAKKK